MRLGIMQPYFFPNLSHFALIEKTTAWIVFDITQYTPKSWMNRNRILRPDRGWMYVTVPLKASTQNMRTVDARILDPATAQRSLTGKLSHYRRRAPHFDAVMDLVRDVFGDLTGDSLVELNVIALRKVCAYMGIPFFYQIASEMPLPIASVAHPGGWAPAIAQSLGAEEYVNPIGGSHLFDPDDFVNAGVRLRFLDMPEFVYRTPGFDFEPGLSILDVLMWNDLPIIMEALRMAKLVTGDGS